MRPGILAAGIVALILVSRYYSLSETEALSGSESVAPVTTTPLAFDEPVDGLLSPSLVDSSMLESARACLPTTNLRSSHASEAPERHLYSDGQSKFDVNAMNVQLLVRAQYEIPKNAAELLMKLDTQMLVEITELESGHQDIAILQVTTDEDTQKQFAGFLSALYPPESIDCCREHSDERDERDEFRESEFRRVRNAKDLTARETPSLIGTDTRF